MDIERQVCLKLSSVTSEGLTKPERTANNGASTMAWKVEAKT